MTAVSKALTILEAFTPQRPRITLRELAAITGFSEPTVHRLTNELVTWGALERQPRGPFSIGLKLWPIASLAAVPRTLREEAVAFLGDLYEATGENVLLAILDGDEALVLARLAGRRAVGLNAREGARLPLHASGVGQVLLAFAPEDVRRNVLAADLTRFTKNTITDPDELEQTLTQVRSDGHAVCIGAMREDSMSVAAPVFGPSNEVIAALSIVIHDNEATRTRYAEVVATVANGISRTVGSTRRAAVR